MANFRTQGIVIEEQVSSQRGIQATTQGQTPGCVCHQRRPAGSGRCPCSGSEKTGIAGLGKVPGYQGDFPSPLQVMWYAPENRELLKLKIPDPEIRTWIREAAEYHGIPHVLLAVILQQENGPNATEWQKIGQFGERSLTTFAAIMDEVFWDLVPDRVAGGSSGFANMSRAALLDAVQYTRTRYCKNVLPDSVRYRALGFDSDTRISGDDWKNDLYYCAAHLRQLIDRITARACHRGLLTLPQLKRVIGAYNGSGPKAEKYASDAMRKLEDAVAGKTPLYFYEE